MRQWKRDHGSRSRRLGIRVEIVRNRCPVRGAAAVDEAVAVLIAGASGLPGTVVSHAALPPARAPVPLRRQRRDDAVAMRARLWRGRRQALRHGGGGRALRARVRARAQLRGAPDPARCAAAAPVAPGPRRRGGLPGRWWRTRISLTHPPPIGVGPPAAPPTWLTRAARGLPTVGVTIGTSLFLRARWAGASLPELP